MLISFDTTCLRNHLSYLNDEKRQILEIIDDLKQLKWIDSNNGLYYDSILSKQLNKMESLLRCINDRLELLEIMIEKLSKAEHESNEILSDALDITKYL